MRIAFRWRWLLVTLMGWLLVAGTGMGIPQLLSAIAQPPPTTELRGVWLTNIDSDVLFSRLKLRRGMERLARLHFNTVYPTVWNWGYTLYPSDVAQAVIGQRLDPEPGLQGRDMLAEAVEQGHRLGLAVIPWFEFGFMAPADSTFVQRHPDWITSRRDGSQVVMEGKHPRVWLNPFHPQVQQFIVATIAEIVARYDVDGIQFDDHFGLPVELGYDAFTVQLYQQEHQGMSPPENHQDAEWVRWRANKITNVTAQLFHTIKALKPACIVSLSPNPYQFSYENYLQDWATWEQQGLIEELIVQIYRNDIERFVLELEAPVLESVRRRIPVGIGILAGLKNRNVPIGQIRQQVETVRRYGYAGVSFFFYETLGNRDQAFRAMFANPAQRPPLPTP
jgi:uncharacterized lipoprotein YddW (UPF0748 family)